MNNEQFVAVETKRYEVLVKLELINTVLVTALLENAEIGWSGNLRLTNDNEVYNLLKVLYPIEYAQVLEREQAKRDGEENAND